MTRSILGIVVCSLLTVRPAVAQTPVAASRLVEQQQPAPPSPLFPEGAKIAFVNLQVVFEQSALGRESFARLRTFDTEKEAELRATAKQLEDLQQRLDSQQALLSADAASLLAREVEFKARQLQFDRENVQIGRERLQQELLVQFNRRVVPEAEKIRAARGLWLILSVADAGVVAAHPGLDLSAEIVQALDAARESR